MTETAVPKLVTVAAERLGNLARRIFLAAGVAEDQVEVVVNHLIEANLAGHDSHGIHLIPLYIGQIRDGSLDPVARPEIVRERAATALVDGKWAFGQYAARFGTEIAIRKAKAEGVALVSVVRCNHIGRLGDYVTQAAREDVAAFVTVGWSHKGWVVAPHGGREGVLETNPLAFGFPTRESPTFISDFATSSIAYGKVAVAKAKGEQLKVGQMIDKQGQPATDPALLDKKEAALTTMGAHKGYALSVMVSLWGGVLTNDGTLDDGKQSGGTLIVAIDAGVFGDADRMIAEADRYLAMLREVPPADGFTEVLTPGEPEARSRTRRLAEGIPVPESTWRELAETAATLGVSVE